MTRFGIAALIFSLPLALGLAAFRLEALDPSDAASQPDATTAGISIEIAAPEHFHKRIIALDEPLPVVVTNTSKQPVRIWRDWCSWGYFQLSFEVKDDAGHTWTISRKEREFWKNYPDYWTLAPGEPLVLNVTLSSDIWETSGGKLADLRGKSLKVKAIFAAQADDRGREDSVWSGRAGSTPRMYEIQ